MSSLPLVCICIPCYNSENTIEETLCSLLSQTYQNIEIHIFDNASSDNSLQIVSKMDDPRLMVHQAESTSDAETNFTRCLNLGRGDYTAIYHADDLYNPDMVQQEVAYLENNQESGGVLTFAHLIDETGKRIKTSLAPGYLQMDKGSSKSIDVVMLIKAVLREHNFLFCPSAMIRTAVCTDLLKEWRGKLFASSADLDTWFRIADETKLGLINKPLLKYRISTAQYSSTYNATRTERADIFKVLDHWISKPEINNSLNRSDLDWYKESLVRDDILRAVNALKKGDRAFAKQLASTLPSLHLLRMSFLSLRGLKYFLLAQAIKLSLIPSLGSILAPLLRRI